FFFQAEDGIRDLIVTGVQTCALPICDTWVLIALAGGRSSRTTPTPRSTVSVTNAPICALILPDPVRPRRVRRHRGTVFVRHRTRSEERRVGKECRSRGWT